MTGTVPTDVQDTHYSQNDRYSTDWRTGTVKNGGKGTDHLHGDRYSREWCTGYTPFKG
jgi:hypothetical protein